ncbi:MAG TPA: efflux RND transporter permease subunit [Vicinamibacteria bacterium]|nr:efflux RND transporter permease subunit [Vicinamibacteria bacterium]
MNVARFASRNSRAILLGILLLSAAGLYSMATLPSNIYPEVEFPRIQMVAHAGDLPPRMMQLAVTRPLEEAARTVLGVRRVRSKTIRGACEISVIFNPDADMPYSLQLVQAKADEVKPELPAGTQLVVERMTPSLFPIFSVNVTGGLPPADLRDLAVYQLRPLLSRVPGVASVEVLASEEREISVVVDPDRLNAARVTLGQVGDALRATNQVVSVGRLPKDYRQYLVLTTAELASVEDVRRVVVTFRQGTPLYLGDLAEVREGVVDRTTLISGNGQPAALVNVARQIRGNILAVADGAWTALREYRPSLPPSVRLQVVYDLAEFVRSAVANVRDAILIGGILAVLVLVGFLRDLRVTAIAAVSLPLTMIGTFFVLRLAGGTVNLMSLGGLAIAIGLVIDDAIVVVENIHRHRSMGEKVAQAAEKGTQELLAAVVGSTLTTVVVFVPLGLLGGVVGQFFAALSLTLAGAVLLSLAYALLFIPNAAARFLGDRSGPAASLGWLTGRYRILLTAAVRRPRLVIGITLGLAALGALLYFRLETGFLPEMDEGGYVIDYWTPEGTSLAETDRMVHRIEAVVAATPEVAGFARRTGTELGLFATEQNRGDIVVKLKPASARKRRAEEVIEEQRATFAAQMPGMTIEFVQLLQDMLGDLEGNPEPIEVKIFGDDLAQIGPLAARTAERLRKIPGIVDLVVPQRGNPEVDVRVDPTRAARLGFTAEEVAKQLSAGLLGQVATSFRRGDRLIDVRVRFPDRKRFDLDWIREFPLTTASGEIVPLSTTSAISLAQGETQLFREDLEQMVPVTARLEGRDLGSGVREVRAALAADPWPIGTSYRIGGLFESQQASFRSMMLILAIAALLVLAVLVAQFRRFTPALVILSAAPLSLVGAFGLLLLTGTPLNVSSFMGLILLIGLVVKNGIILVDYADIVRGRAGNATEALVEAGTVRLRPILMTTLCTLFGLLPLALGLGSGAELQKPLAIAVIGGLSVSTAVTLLFVPTVLSVLHARQGGEGEGGRREAPA